MNNHNQRAKEVFETLKRDNKKQKFKKKERARVKERRGVRETDKCVFA